MHGKMDRIGQFVLLQCTYLVSDFGELQLERMQGLLGLAFGLLVLRLVSAVSREESKQLSMCASEIASAKEGLTFGSLPPSGATRRS
jgi:hypothetical protein